MVNFLWMTNLQNLWLLVRYQSKCWVLLKHSLRNSEGEISTPSLGETPSKRSPSVSDIHRLRKFESSQSLVIRHVLYPLRSLSSSFDSALIFLNSMDCSGETLYFKLDSRLTITLRYYYYTSSRSSWVRDLCRKGLWSVYSDAHWLLIFLVVTYLCLSRSTVIPHFTPECPSVLYVRPII